MSRERRRLIYIAVWTVVLLILLMFSVSSFGYEDSKDTTLAVMFLVVPVFTMIADMGFFFLYDKFYSHAKFVVINFLCVFGAVFIIESVVILVSFGIRQPQTKLFVFALIFAIMTAVLNLFQSCFLGMAMGKKRA